MGRSPRSSATAILEQLLATLTVLAVGPLVLTACERDRATASPDDPRTEQAAPSVVAPEVEGGAPPQVEASCSGEASCAGDSEAEASCAG